MYQMKKIIDQNEEINLPKCMYRVRNANESLKDETDTIISSKINSQVMKFLKAPSSKMSELEQRQEVLIKKLDTLYDRIKTISSYCNLSNGPNENVKEENNITFLSIPTPEEVVLVVNSDNIPWYLNKVLRETTDAVANLSWHIHSSVSNEKVAKIKAFVKGLKITGSQSKINLRLIFKSVSDPELRLSSLAVPIVGTVNILRYLSYAYPNTIPYDGNDFEMDSLLDVCHILEKTTDKNKENIVKKLFSDCKDWIYKNKFSVVDLAAYNVIKQSKSSIKHAPKAWFDKCEKMCV